MKSGVISPEQESSKANEIYEIQKELDKKLNRIRETHSHILFQKRETLNKNKEEVKVIEKKFSMPIDKFKYSAQVPSDLNIKMAKSTSRSQLLPYGFENIDSICTTSSKIFSPNKTNYNIPRPKPTMKMSNSNFFEQNQTNSKFSTATHSKIPSIGEKLAKKFSETFKNSADYNQVVSRYLNIFLNKTNASSDEENAEIKEKYKSKLIKVSYSPEKSYYISPYRKVSTKKKESFLNIPEEDLIFDQMILEPKKKHLTPKLNGVQKKLYNIYNIDSDYLKEIKNAKNMKNDLDLESYQQKLVSTIGERMCKDNRIALIENLKKVRQLSNKIRRKKDEDSVKNFIKKIEHIEESIVYNLNKKEEMMESLRCGGMSKANKMLPKIKFKKVLIKNK